MDNLIGFMKITTRKTQVLVKRLKAYQALRAKGLTNLPILEKNLAVIKGLLADFPDTAVKDSVLGWYSEEASAITKAKDEFRFTFGRAVQERLEKEGIALTGQLPILRAGYFTLTINFELGTASLFWGPEIATVKSRLPLIPEHIAAAMTHFLARLGKKDFDPEGFARKLFLAYRRHAMFNALAPGTKVFLVDLLGELAIITQSEGFRVDPAQERFREYSRVRFGFDLYRLRASESTTVENHRLKLSVATFDATTEKKRSLWVPDNDRGDGTYYSYISFEPMQLKN